MQIKPKKNDLLVKEIRRSMGKNADEPLSDYQLAKGAWRIRKTFNRELRSIFLMILGVFSAGFGLKGFLIPNHLIDGGVMGISLLVNKTGTIPLALLIIVFNLPFIFLGYHQISRIFSLKSMLAIALLALVVGLFPYPHVTNDKILVAVFGGFFIGGGIGLCIRGGGVIDGTEVLAIYLSRRSSLTVGDLILIFNVCIFSAAIYILNVESALYSILTYLAASKTVDFILEGIEEFTGVTVISPHTHEITEFITSKMGRGVTIYQGKRGYGKRGETAANADIIFTVITRLEVNRLTTEIERIDPHAFIVMQSIRDTKGGMVKKKPAQHI